MNRRPRPLIDLALAFTSAILLILTFPRVDAAWLAPFALVPLLFALAREPRPSRRFLLGWICGIAYWFGVCYWIQGVLERYGDMGVFGSWATFLLFAVLKGLHMGVFSLLAAVLLLPWYAVPAVAALWVGIERTHADFGFAWLALGNAGIDYSLPLRVAPYIGVYGLSFIFMLIAGTTTMVLLRRGRIQLLWLLPVPALLLFPELPKPEKPAQTAVVVQPNISEDQTWTPLSAELMRERLVSLSFKGALRAKPDLILWPEAPAPIYYYRDPALRRSVGQLARITHAYVLFGTVAENPQGAPLNSAVLVGPSGQLLGRYDKVNLVPFGEYVPRLFDFVNRITKEAGDFVPGSRIEPLDAGEHRLGTFICYESVFPSEVREFVKRGAGVLVNLSNDGYFGRSAAREQHLKIARMRAVENRRWLLRDTNDGITVSIDPAGRIVDRLPGFQERVAPFGYSYVRSATPYTLYGDWFAWTCLIAAFVALFFSQWPHYKPRSR